MPAIDAEFCRRRADALLMEATRTPNMKERGWLIDEAMHWHNLAMDCDGHHLDRLNDNGPAPRAVG